MRHGSAAGDRVVIRYFNLMEILIALGVIAVGLVAVIGLFPVGLNSARDAIADSYAADAADHMLHVVAANLRDDWSIVTNDKIADDPPDISPSALSGSWTEVAEGLDFMLNSDGEYIYRMEQTTAGDTTVVDFTAILRIWKTPTEGWKYDGSSWTTATDTNFDTRVQLNMEISYPSTLPYSAREKRHFAMEVMREQ